MPSLPERIAPVRLRAEPLTRLAGPAVSQLVGLRADKSWRLGDHRLMVMLDVFNVLNSNAVSNFTLINGANFNKILGALQPRTFQVGTRVEF